MTTRLQDQLFHDVFMPDETRAIRQEVRAFVECEVAPVADRIAQQDESVETFPWDVFRKMAECGLFQIPFQKQHGGRGLAYPACATIVTMEELAYASNSVAAIYDVQCMLAGQALMYGSPELQERYLVPLIRGDKVACFATSEPGASSDLSVRSLRTTARQEGKRWIVNGRKRWITNSPVGDFVVALCKTGDSLTSFVVDLHAPGVSVGVPDKKTGNRGQLTADIILDEVGVPAEDLVGKVGAGLRVMLGALTYGRMGIGATGVGMAQAALDEAVEYLKTREAFGKKIAQFQYWQIRMAEMFTQVENARSLCYKAAFRRDQGVEFPEPEAAMAKYYASAIAGDVAREAVQVFGGYGYTRLLGADQSTYKVEQIYRDCKIAEIYEGTNEIQRFVIARQIFGKEYTG
jgi:alkylation response protein AidB-like acyl-CoA dehydrogenase